MWLFTEGSSYSRDGAQLVQGEGHTKCVGWGWFLVELAWCLKADGQQIVLMLDPDGGLYFFLQDAGRCVKQGRPKRTVCL